MNFQKWPILCITLYSKPIQVSNSGGQFDQLLSRRFTEWIPFLMFETLNSCRRKLVFAKILPTVEKNLSWCALLLNFKKNQKRKLVSSQIRLVHFPHLRGHFWGVTTSEIQIFLSIFGTYQAAPTRYISVPFGRTVEFPFQFGRWRLFDSCLLIKANLLDETCSFVFVDCFFSNEQL